VVVAVLAQLEKLCSDMCQPHVVKLEGNRGSLGRQKDPAKVFTCTASLKIHSVSAKVLHHVTALKHCA